jgi:lipopolysaccharide biosynthesis glycosyltransferase
MNLNIVFGVDDNFAKHCGATIASILSNHKIKEDKIKILLIGDLNDYNKNKFVALKKIQDFEIEFLKINEKDFKDLPIFKSYGSKTKSFATYYRLLITEILPSSIEKVIYLDCDVILNKDISELWSTNVDNYLAACVELDNGYFNAGVMILNLYELRKFKFYDKWKKYIKDNSFKIDYDQGILNDVIGHNVLFLPTNWNL